MSLFNRSQKFEFPGNDDRVAIVGATGSGKSTAGLWLFSESASFNKQPWIIVDYKGEKIVAQMLKRGDANLIDMTKAIPKRPGIYVVKPHPQRPEEIIDFLWKVYDRNKIGVFIDELMSVPKQFDLHNNPLQALLTQGRSKEIPMYLLTQRPARVSISTFSDATFIWEFELNRADDRKTVREYIPDNNTLFATEGGLPRYWSRWWDSKRRLAFKLKPVPNASVILDTVSHRIDKMQSTAKF